MLICVYILLEITTVEGILGRCINGLEQEQPVRKIMQPEAAAQIEAFLERLRDTKDLKSNFTLVRSTAADLLIKFEINGLFNISQVIDDPSGNSYIENLHAPHPDPALTTNNYTRTKDQDHSVGIYTEELKEIAEEEEKEGVYLTSPKFHSQINVINC